jgi:hypothetical protein
MGALRAVEKLVEWWDTLPVAFRKLESGNDQALFPRSQAPE